MSYYQQLSTFFTTSPYDDPLASLRIPYIDEYIKPLYTHDTLDKHIHGLIGAVLAYHSIYVLSSIISPLLFPKTFKTLSTKTKIDFHVHVVSMIQSLLILVLIYPAFNHPALIDDRVFGYVPYSGFLTTLALGYFIWDTIISLVYVQYFGVGFLFHGIISAFVFFVGLSPFISFYAPVFILFEISTPFLNLRWFGLKFPNLFSETFNLINNAILISIFFFIRIGYGWYSAILLFKDFYEVYDDPRFSKFNGAVMFFGYLGLSVLNLYWFYRMAKVAYAILADMFTGSNERDEVKKDI